MRSRKPWGKQPTFWEFPLPPLAESLLEGLAEGQGPLEVISILSQSLPLEEARVAAELHKLRLRARRRFPGLSLPYLHAKGLEQASSETVARARAGRMAALAPGATVLDATAGVGADAVALYLEGLEVVAADLDPASLACARANLEHHGAHGRVLLADAARPAARTDLFVVDPDRRAGEGRSLDPAAWSPTLAECLAALSRFEGGCVKLAPALASEVLRAAEDAALPRDLGRRREWVSRNGELAEIGLWTGILADAEADPNQRVAVLLGADGSRHEFAGVPSERPALSAAAALNASFLGDPDPAIIRAGLLGTLAKDEGLRPLAPGLGYLAGDKAPSSPLLRAMRVVDSTPLDRKQVRKMLRKHDIGPISVRKRGHRTPTEVLARRLRGDGAQRGELLIARLDAGHRAYLVQRL